MIRIVTDSAADYTAQEIIDLQLDVVNLSIHFDDFDYDVTKDDKEFNQFYTFLGKTKSIPKTSQPSPEAYVNLFKDAMEKGDEVIVICLSGELSGTYQTACVVRDMVGYQKVHIIDSRQAIFAQRALVDYAIKLRSEGRDALEIVAEVEKIKGNICIFGVVETLKYLHMGGRLSKTASVVGELLTIKPIISLEDGAVIMESKKRGTKKAVTYIQQKLEVLGFDESFPVYFGYSKDFENGLSFMNDTINQLSLSNCCGPFGVGGTIGSHIGPNGLALVFFKKS